MHCITPEHVQAPYISAYTQHISSAERWDKFINFRAAFVAEATTEMFELGLHTCFIRHTWDMKRKL